MFISEYLSSILLQIALRTIQKHHNINDTITTDNRMDHWRYCFSRIYLASSRIGMRHGLPTIRQFIWIWESLQRPFGSTALSFTFHAAFTSISLSPLFSLFPPFSFTFVLPFLFSQLTLSLPFRGSLRRASARFYPAFRDWRHLSWMDRQSSFAPRPSAHLPSAALVVASLRQCLFAHSMGDYAASEFTHSRKVHASCRRVIVCG